jgi:hypothetical protein
MFFSGSWHLVRTRRFFNDDPELPRQVSSQVMPITRTGMGATGFLFGMEIRTESGAGGGLLPGYVSWEEGVPRNKVQMSKGGSPPIHFMIAGR